MGNQMKSFGAVAALGFAVLFFGASQAQAQAQDRFSGSQRFGGHGQGAFQGRGDHQFSHRGARDFSHRSFTQFPVRHRGFARPFYPRSSRVFAGARRYRLERVFLYAPFPHWGFRRVYFSGPGYGAYCDPY
jgi:hypothetical protein